MAHSVIIQGIVYANCPEVNIPIDPNEGGGTAKFMDTSDATLTGGGQMLNGYTSYSGGTKYTGSIPTKTSADLTASGATVTVPTGYYATSASKSVASGTATTPATTITATPSVTVNSAGLVTATISGSQSITPTISAGYISAGTAGTVSVTGSDTLQLTTKGATTYTPGTSSQTIAADTYLTGVQTISGDANLVSSSIVSGISIFGVAGSATVPLISQDGVTKVLSIS